MGVGAGIVKTLHPHNRVGQAMTYDEEVVSGIVARGQFSREGFPLYDLEPVGLLERCRLNVLVACHDPWPSECQGKGRCFL